MTTVKYPTDPLTFDEINAVTAAVKADPFLGSLFPPFVPYSQTALFLEVLLKEPKKAYVLAYDQNPTLPLKRKARVHLYLNNSNVTYKITLKMDEPPSVGVSDLKYKKVNKVMYPYNNYDNFPVSDSFGGLQAFQEPNKDDPPYNYFTRLELTNLVLACKPLLKKLEKRNVTLQMLQPQNIGNETDTGAEIYPYAYYTFESFRNFLSCCGKICPDLVDIDAPNHRYMPAVFFNQSIIPGGICIETANWGIVEGIYIIVDCTAKSIYRIIDDGHYPKSGLPPIPLPVQDPYPVIFHPNLKPLCVTMPDGVSFEVPEDDQHLVRWDNWEFRWSYQRSGVTIYNVYYTETVNGVSEKRKIIYKNAASDTLVVYNVDDPIIARTYVSADSHNWPVLPRMTTLVRGRDVPGYAKLLPINISNGKGSAFTLVDAVAIFEQDRDLLWRVNQGVINALQWPNATDPYLTGCRKRQLVVMSIFSGFYYLFAYSYIFNQDGSMECYIDLMGQTTNQWVESNTDGEQVPNGRRIAKQLVALNHTHSTTWRIDFDIDGLRNEVYEHNINTVCDSGAKECNLKHCNSKNCCDGEEDNKPGCNSCHGGKDKKSQGVSPCGDAVACSCLSQRAFEWEKEAKRNQCIETNRTWSVQNPHSTNRLGFARGYKIYGASPNGNASSRARANGAAHTHLPFLKHHLFVTKYDDKEQFAAGEWPVLTNKPTGLVTYQEENRNIKDTDIVVWFNTMYFHSPHTEDYAFISTQRTGLTLIPFNFFGYNPANSLEQNKKVIRDILDNPIGDCSFPEYFHYDDCSK